MARPKYHLTNKFEPSEIMEREIESQYVEDV